MNRFLLVVVIPLLIFTTPTQAYSERTEHDMKIHFIDVGQGDSILIQTPSYKTILIDGGPPEAGKKVVAYLKERNIKSIDLLIATHPDFDHIGGLIQVMKNFNVKRLVDTGKFHLTKTYATYLNEIRKSEIPKTIAKENQQLQVDPNVKMEVLNAFKKGKNNNESSIVLKVNYEDIDMLLMSDVEIEQEQTLMKRKDIEAEIIKVAHHGSDTSTSLPFLRAVNPEVAILTYSPENDYGHPVERVIENLDRMDVNIFSTAVYGNLVITTNGEDYVVLTEKEPYQGLSEKSA